MRHASRRLVVALGATTCLLVTAAAGTTWAVAGTRTASTADLEQMSGAANFPLAPPTLWAMTKDAASLCQLVPVCSWAEPVAGRPGTFTVYVNDHETLGGIDPLGMIPVTVTVADTKPGEAVSVDIGIQGGFGSFDSNATITMTADGRGGTQVVYRTVSASGTGVVGRLALDQITSTFDERLAESSESVAAQAEAQPATILGVAVSTPRRGRTGVNATVSMIAPDGFPAGIATGTMRVYVGSSTACAAPIAQSVARCVVRNAPRPRTAVVVAEGTFDNGITFTVAKRIRLKGTRS